MTILRKIIFADTDVGIKHEGKTFRGNVQCFFGAISCPGNRFFFSIETTTHYVYIFLTK